MKDKSHMEIGKALRGLIAKEGRSLRRTSIDLGVDRSTLFQSLKKGNPEWKTIEKILDYLGYEIRFVKPKRKEVKPENSKPSESRRRKGDRI